MTDRTVFQSISRPHLVTTTPQSTVLEAARVMARAHSGSVLILDEAGAAIGIFTEKNSLWDNTHPEWLPKERLEIFKEVYVRVQEVLDQVYLSEIPPIILHADLHEGNFKQNRSRLTVFDFDDCALGYPVQDFAVTFYSLSNENDYEQNRDAFKRGYSSLRPWLPEYNSLIEALIAGRSLVLANDVVQSLNPEWHKIAPRFFERSEKRLRNFLNSGQSTVD